MRIARRVCAGVALFAASVCEGAIAPVEDPDACLSTEQRAELAQRSRELFFRGGGNAQLVLAQAAYREASDAHERAAAELRRCEASVAVVDPGADGRCAPQRASLAQLERDVAAARAEQARRNAELADELTARARRMREEYRACAPVR